jgi:hypothetical protein
VVKDVVPVDLALPSNSSSLASPGWTLWAIRADTGASIGDPLPASPGSVLQVAVPANLPAKILYIASDSHLQEPRVAPSPVFATNESAPVCDSAATPTFVPSRASAATPSALLQWATCSSQYWGMVSQRVDVFVGPEVVHSTVVGQQAVDLEVPLLLVAALVTANTTCVPVHACVTSQLPLRDGVQNVTVCTLQPLMFDVEPPFLSHAAFGGLVVRGVASDSASSLGRPLYAPDTVRVALPRPLDDCSPLGPMHGTIAAVVGGRRISTTPFTLTLTPGAVAAEVGVNVPVAALVAACNRLRTSSCTLVAELNATDAAGNTLPLASPPVAVVLPWDPQCGASAGAATLTLTSVDATGTLAPPASLTTQDGVIQVVNGLAGAPTAIANWTLDLACVPGSALLAPLDLGYLWRVTAVATGLPVVDWTLVGPLSNRGASGSVVMPLTFANASGPGALFDLEVVVQVLGGARVAPFAPLRFLVDGSLPGVGGVQLRPLPPPQSACASLCWSNASDADTPLDLAGVRVCVGTSHSACDVVPWTPALPSPGGAPGGPPQCPTRPGVATRAFTDPTDPTATCVWVTVGPQTRGAPAGCSTFVPCIALRDGIHSSATCGAPTLVVASTPAAPVGITLVPVEAKNETRVSVPTTMQLTWDGGEPQRGCHAGAWLEYCVTLRGPEGLDKALLPCTRAPDLQGQLLFEVLDMGAREVQATVQMVSPNGGCSLVLRLWWLRGSGGGVGTVEVCMSS